jgi:hypothetical protein
MRTASSTEKTLLSTRFDVADVSILRLVTIFRRSQHDLTRPVGIADGECLQDQVEAAPFFVGECGADRKPKVVLALALDDRSGAPSTGESSLNPMTRRTQEVSLRHREEISDALDLEHEHGRRSRTPPDRNCTNCVRGRCRRESSRHLRSLFKFIRESYLEKDGIRSVVAPRTPSAVKRFA